MIEKQVHVLKQKKENLPHISLLIPHHIELDIPLVGRYSLMYKCKHCNELLFYQSSYVFFSSSLYYFSVLDHVDSTKLQDSQYKPSPLSDSILIPLSFSNTEYISKSTSSIPLSDYSSMSILNEDYEQSTPNKFSFPERIVQEQTELLESVQNTIPYAISNEPPLTPKQECSVETSQEEDA